MSNKQIIMEKAILSKSTYLKGMQCEKALYLYKNHYNLRDEISPQQQAIFEQGTNVGMYAQQLFPNGVDASPENYWKLQDSVHKTKKFIEAGEQVIYEATFQFDSVIVAVDILVKHEEGWKAYEVKSSSEVKPVNIIDASIQFYTIVNSGIDLKDISIAHINSEYVKKGAIDVSQLFNIESVYNEIQSLIPEIPSKITYFKKLIKQHTIPLKSIGPQCTDPYDCDFKGTCWKDIPEYSIFDINNLRTTKKFEWFQKGIIRFDQIGDEIYTLNENQQFQVRGELQGTTFVDKINISKFIQELEYPIYHLDFETINPAVPIYENSRPYEQLVFQYSLHIENQNGQLEHKEYLAIADSNVDPRDQFVQQLIEDCGQTGDILVYNIVFEKGKLIKLKEVYPQFEVELQAIIIRLKDLMVPFQQKWYYTPKMKGSYSIKYVLPALVPEMSYQDLEIQEGGTASTVFEQMVLNNYNGEFELARKNLAEYCKMDTYAMVKILEKMREALIS